MRPASDSLLNAVERTVVGEDRLTEVLACVAHVNQDFAAKLVRWAGVKVGYGVRYAVGTQRLTPSGRRVDMEIGVYRDLQRCGLVWVEVKAGASYQPNQLEDYAHQVKDVVYGHPEGRVLTIVPPSDRRPAVTPAVGTSDWATMTWAEVARVADHLGRAWDRAAWRVAATEPSTPAQWRYLAELVGLLERKGYARMTPITAEDVVAAQRMTTLKTRLEDLVRAASAGVNLETSGKPTWSEPACYQQFSCDEGAWFRDSARFKNAYPELLYSPAETWTTDQRRLPAFCAGITFNQIKEAEREILQNEDWTSLPGGVTVGGSGDLLRVVRTKYLSTLVAEGPTLDDQVQALSDWACNAFAAIMDERVKPPAARLA